MRKATLAILLLIAAVTQLKAQGTQPSAIRVYQGAGSCAASNCHGGVWPKTGGNVNQNEYNVWSSERDKHSKAYKVLLEPRSKQIATNMKIDRPETAALCLDCHSTNAPQNMRASGFDLSDGVGCESCHGPSSAWLGPHTTKDWTHEQSMRSGMNDLRNPAYRTQMCLSCHLGNQLKTVGHELIAAGHPDLIFELETFSSLMPAHWRPASEKTDTLHRWAVAQTIGLRESLEQLRRRLTTDSTQAWPDFADFECSSCHHTLVMPSVRQTRGYTGKAGLAPWNESRYIVMRHLIATISPAALTELDSRVSDLKKSFESSNGHTKAADVAKRIVDMTNEWIPLIEKSTIDPSVVSRMLRSITADASTIAWAGIRSAEQATMSVDVLYNASHPGKREDAVNKQIEQLYQLLESQVRYDPDQFATALKKIGAAL